MIREPLIFEISEKGKRAYSLPEIDVPVKEDILRNLPLRSDIKGFPEVSEVEIVRHFTRLSRTNYCVDEGFYPLGSCTMKYNPKINEKVASILEFTASHPYAPSDLVQGISRFSKQLKNSWLRSLEWMRSLSNLQPELRVSCWA